MTTAIMRILILPPAAAIALALPSAALAGGNDGGQYRNDGDHHRQHQGHQHTGSEQGQPCPPKPPPPPCPPELVVPPVVPPPVTPPATRPTGATPPIPYTPPTPAPAPAPVAKPKPKPKPCVKGKHRKHGKCVRNKPRPKRCRPGFIVRTTKHGKQCAPRKPRSPRFAG